MESKVGHVVIADGDEQALAHTSAVLRRGGYETVPVTTGGEALDAVAANGVSLVLLEVRLADMTGYEVCHEIRRRRGDDVPVFFVTGMRTEPLDRVAGLLIGADDFIVKPFEPDELIARARRFTGRSRATHRTTDAGDWPDGVTPRELEVLCAPRGRAPAQGDRRRADDQSEDGGDSHPAPSGEGRRAQPRRVDRPRIPPRRRRGRHARGHLTRATPVGRRAPLPPSRRRRARRRSASR